MHARIVRLLLLVALLMTAVGHLAGVQAQTNATLEVYTPGIEYLAAGSTEWVSVTAPILVEAGDEIRTDASGWGLVTYFDGAYTELLPETQMKIEALSASGNDFTITVNVVVGNTLNALDRTVQGDSQFEIVTPSVTASVRGTLYYVLVDRDGNTTVSVLRGTVDTRPQRVLETTFIVHFIDAGSSAIFTFEGDIQFIPGEIITPAFFTSRVSAVLAQACATQEDINAQVAVIDALTQQLAVIRAYKDATIVELSRLNAVYYAVRAELLRAIFEREALLRERAAILQGAANGLPIDAQIRLIDIEDRLFELNLLLGNTSSTLAEQLLLVTVLWRPVIKLVGGVSVERYERFTQRILEVIEGGVVRQLEIQISILRQLQETACTDYQFNPSGIGSPNFTGQ
jgi:hypothetical protein